MCLMGWQVGEVLGARTRLSVNGWFYGPPFERPPPYIEPVPVRLFIVAAAHQTCVMSLQAPMMLTPVTDGSDAATLAKWVEWINEDYLDGAFLKVPYCSRMFLNDRDGRAAEAMVRIQLTMEEESNIELPDFLNKAPASLARLK